MKKKSPLRPDRQRPRRPGAPRPRTIHVLSDSTGNLARHMVTTFLTQFPPTAFEVEVFSFVQNEDRLNEVLEQVAARPGIVLHAVVSPQFKRRIARHSKTHDLPCRDLTGPFVEFLAGQAGIEPRDDQRLVHPVDEAYHRRIRAMEFTLEHDDGLGLDTLHEADVVLTGISRTSKTPTSIFLSQHGFHVANVSLAPQVQPPGQLLALPRNKVVGLWVDPSVLAEIRARRAAAWRMGQSDYSDPDQVNREVVWSRRLFSRQNWHSLEITNQAVEETAGRIINLLGLGAVRF